MQKTILITGCSSGIGLSAAQTLLKRGYRVFAGVRKMEDLNRLKELGLVDALILDVNDSQSIRHGLDEVLDKTGGTLDALFNNAGYAVPGAVEDITREMMRAQFETNVFGPMELTNLVLPIMRKQGHGRIIQNTSILGIVAMPFRGAYNASKFALEGFTQTLRQELVGTGIHVAIIAPGPIESKFRDNAYQSYQQTLQHKQSQHTNAYKEMEKHYFTPTDDQRKYSLPADAVTEKLIQALESKRPKTRYYIGFPAHLFGMLRRLLPESSLDWLMNKTHKDDSK